MAKISVKHLGDHLFEVSVTAQTTTTHQVTALPEYVANLLKPNESVESLLERSFMFLLAREANTSILRSFDLSVIERYFPEYSREITNH